MNIKEVRRQRDMMLEATDFYVMVSDFPISDEERQAWIDYRTQLRDITTMSSFSIENDFWPLPPRRYKLKDGSSINLPLDYSDRF